MDLKKLVKSKNLKIIDVAKVLWPDNKHPRHAFDYHCKEHNQLSLNQLQKLAELINSPLIYLINEEMNK